MSDLILMQRIFPPIQPAALVTRGKVITGPSLSELGVFGTYLKSDHVSKSGGVLVNSYGGHILRTKLDGVDEGGVATGYAVLSSPILVD